MTATPFGRLLRELRWRNGLSQSALGAGTCTRAHVSAIEQGHGRPSGLVVRSFLERLPERRALVEALCASYDPRPDWIHAGVYLALRGEQEGARTIFRALAQASGPGADRGKALAARAQGWTRFLDGEVDQALERLDTAVRRYRRAGRFQDAARTLWELGTAMAETVLTPDVVRFFQAARATWVGETAERTRFQAVAYHSEARALRRMGFYRRAREAAQMAARLYREAGDRVEEGHALMEEAYAAHEMGSRGALRPIAQEALHLFHRTDHASCLGAAELAVAIAILDESPEEAGDAAVHIARAQELLASGSGGLEGHALSERARLAWLQGDARGARGYLEGALGLPADPWERMGQLCLAAAVGLRPWPRARQEIGSLSRALASPWERHAFFRSGAMACERLRRWEWAGDLHRLSHYAYEGFWDGIAAGGTGAHPAMGPVPSRRRS